MFSQIRWRADFRFADRVAKLELAGARADLTAKLLEWVKLIMRQWQFEQGGRWVGRGLLEPAKKFERLSKDELQQLEPWKCAGSFVNSELGLFLKLWSDKHKHVEEMLDGREFLLWKSFAVLILDCKRPDDYFDARLAADLLTEHMIFESFKLSQARRAFGASQRQTEANRLNASKPRKKIRKTGFAMPTPEQLELFRKNFENARSGSDYGWKSAVSKKYQISRDKARSIHAQLTPGHR